MEASFYTRKYNCAPEAENIDQEDSSQRAAGNDAILTNSTAFCLHSVHSNRPTALDIPPTTAKAYNCQHSRMPQTSEEMAVASYLLHNDLVARALQEMNGLLQGIRYKTHLKIWRVDTEVQRKEFRSEESYFHEFCQSTNFTDKLRLIDQSEVTVL